MRIISPFHDYYDSAAGFALDPTQIYRRQCRQETLEGRFWHGLAAANPLPLSSSSRFKPPVQSITVGFCGRYFPAWLMTDLPFTAESFSHDTKDRHWVTLQEALDLTRDHLSRRDDSKWMQRSIGRQLHVMQQHHTKVAGLPRDSRPFLILGGPVFALSADVRTLQIITNPRLQTIGFEKVIDAFQAFQDISTFLGNELTEINPAPLTVGGDDVVARAKGFDEMSFRTAAPGQKKLNRRMNRLKKRGEP